MIDATTLDEYVRTGWDANTPEWSLLSTEQRQMLYDWAASNGVDVFERIADGIYVIRIDVLHLDAPALRVWETIPDCYGIPMFDETGDHLARSVRLVPMRSVAPNVPPCLWIAPCYG